MKLNEFDYAGIRKECEERGIKRINACFRWLKRNENKTIDNYIAYIKSRPHADDYKYCKDNKLDYNKIRQWVARKEGRTAKDYENRPPFLTQLCEEYGVKYKNAERWLLNHQDRKFEDYVAYLGTKAAKAPSKYKTKVPSENNWIRQHPGATHEEYLEYIRKKQKKTN